MKIQNETITWLLDSDPSIKWQVMRDIQGLDESIYEQERLKLQDQGWGSELLKLQGEDGLWNKSLYNGKWISTTYTLYLLKLLGLSPFNQQALSACDQLFTLGIYNQEEIRFSRNQAHQDLGVSGLVLSMCCHFGYHQDELHQIGSYLVSQQSEVGYWLPNKAEASMGYQFETTLLILEGLLQYRQRYSLKHKWLLEAEAKGQEYLLQHQLYLDGGKAIKTKWTSFSFPAYWFYDVLTALDYFRLFGTNRDQRLQAGINLIAEKQNKAGRWNLGNKHHGKTYIEMEEARAPSRWNTLRALRVLKWWEGSN